MTGFAEGATRRIDRIDILRGIAILFILFMNIIVMSGPFWASMRDPRVLGWSGADQVAFYVNHAFLEGTQRGLLELLFGAGVLLIAAKAMHGDGPVRVADIVQRRALWLILFGLADVFLIMWGGDILFIYGVAALFLFPFRLLRPRTLILLGLLPALWFGWNGLEDYRGRAAQVAAVERADQKQAAGQPLSADERKAVEARQRTLDAKPPPPMQQQAADETKWRQAGFAEYRAGMTGIWLFIYESGFVRDTIIEAFGLMLIGMALFKLGILQGERSRRFYLAMMILSYGFGLTLRYLAARHLVTPVFSPKLEWVLQEPARLATTLGHVALVNLALSTGPGARALAMFKAPGRLAFSIYVLTSIVMLWIIMPSWGLALGTRLSWAELMGLAALVIAVEISLAHLWLRHFLTGPLEWLWRSLVHWQRQPFRRPRQPAIPAEPLPA